MLQPQFVKFWIICGLIGMSTNILPCTSELGKFNLTTTVCQDHILFICNANLNASDGTFEWFMNEASIFTRIFAISDSYPYTTTSSINGSIVRIENVTRVDGIYEFKNFVLSIPVNALQNYVGANLTCGQQLDKSSHIRIGNYSNKDGNSDLIKDIIYKENSSGCKFYTSCDFPLSGCCTITVLDINSTATGEVNSKILIQMLSPNTDYNYSWRFTSMIYPECDVVMYGAFNTSSCSSSSSRAYIIAIAVGILGVVLLAIIVAIVAIIIFCLFKRRKRYCDRSQSSLTIQTNNESTTSGQEAPSNSQNIQIASCNMPMQVSQLVKFYSKIQNTNPNDGSSAPEAEANRIINLEPSIRDSPNTRSKNEQPFQSMKSTGTASYPFNENFEQQQEESIHPPSLFCPDYSSTSEYDDNTR